MNRIGVWGSLKASKKRLRTGRECDVCTRDASRLFRDNVAEVALCTYHANRLDRCTVQLLADER